MPEPSPLSEAEKRNWLPAAAEVVSSTATVIVVDPAGTVADQFCVRLGVLMASAGTVTAMLATFVEDTVPDLIRVAVAAVTPDAGRVPRGVAVMVLVPADWVWIVSSNVP